MSAQVLPLSDTRAQEIALELCELAASGATDAQIASLLLGPVIDEHGEDGAETVIVVLVRCLAGLLLTRPDGA